MVGQQHVDQRTGPLELGELPHPPMCAARCRSRYASAGLPSISASVTFANSTVCRCGSGSTGSASHASTSARPRSVIAYRLRSGPSPGSASPPIDLAVPGQPAERRVDLPERQLLAPAEVGVVVALEVIAVARLPFKQPEQGQGDAHPPEYTLSVYSAQVLGGAAVATPRECGCCSAGRVRGKTLASALARDSPGGPSCLARGTFSSYAGEMSLPLRADSPGLGFQPGDHICAFYNGGGNFLDDIVVDFVSKGLQAGNKCICFMDTPSSVRDRIPGELIAERRYTDNSLPKRKGIFLRGTSRRTHSSAAWKPRSKECFPRDTNASG